MSEEVKKRFLRNCPTCDIKINYSRLAGLHRANKENSSCRKCSNYLRKIAETNISSGYKEFKRSCQEFGGDIFHSTLKGLKQSKYRICPGCGGKILHKTRSALLRAVVENHHCRNCRVRGRRDAKAGYRWSGQYLNFRFRSTYELHFIYNCISEGKNIESAEILEFRIPYVINDKIRNYLPDFIVDDKYLYEIKSENFQNKSSVLLKKEAAEKWCLDGDMNIL